MEVLSSRVIVTPSDFAAVTRFYDQVLGLRRYREYGSGRVSGVVYFLGGGFLEVTGQGPAEGADCFRLWLQVPDVDAEHARLLAAGADVRAAPADMPWGLREMEVADPDGRRILLVQVPEHHPLRRRVG